ncbi:MAG: AMP-binding protein, partial [Longimicrobiales bacterium]
MATTDRNAEGGQEAPVGSRPAGASSPRGDERVYASNPADLPRGTIVELFLRATDEFDKPDAFLRRVEETWEPVSHRAFLGDVVALFHGLGSLGVESGDRVALLSENRLEWALTDYALLAAGALTVPV